MKMKKKKNKEYSKKICTFSLVLFTLTWAIALFLAFLGVSTDIFIYLIPSVSAIAAASVGFYYNKAKVENLSKQRIRNVVLKLVLEEKLNNIDYYEIIDAIENIDTTIEGKLTSMYEETVNDDISVEI